MPELGKCEECEWEFQPVEIFGEVACPRCGKSQKAIPDVSAVIAIPDTLHMGDV